MESRQQRLTGVVSSGVVIGVQALLNFTPLPRSKSQIFTGDTCTKEEHCWELHTWLVHAQRNVN